MSTPPAKRNRARRAPNELRGNIRTGVGLRAMHKAGISVELNGKSAAFVNEFEKALLAAIESCHGDVNVNHWSYAHTATESLRLAMANRELLAKQLRHGRPLTVDQRIKIDDAFGKALERRDRAIAKLDLDFEKKLSLKQMYEGRLQIIDPDSHNNSA